MREVLNTIIFGRNPLVSGALAMAVVLSIALGCNCNKSLDLANVAEQSNTSRASDDRATGGEELPPKSTVENLVRDTTERFRDAVQSEDFADLYNTASQDFQSTYTLDQVDDAFKSYTDKKRLVVPILDKTTSADVEWTRDPAIRTEKGLNILMATGKFPTKPYNVRFDYEYVMRGGEWKLLKLVINIP